MAPWWRDPTIVHATLPEREPIATLVRATLDGMFADIPAADPAMTVLLATGKPCA